MDSSDFEGTTGKDSQRSKVWTEFNPTIYGDPDVRCNKFSINSRIKENQLSSLYYTNLT